MIKSKTILSAILSLALVVGSGASFAQNADVSVELNKLESHDKSCRAFLVIGNRSDTNFQSLKLDLILFRPDGVIERRLALDLAPVRANKTSVKTFDLDALDCDGVSSVLINDAIECKTDSGLVADCLSRLSASSRSTVKFTK